ncbi:hypothetical protein HDV05_006533 [Chytridiales sp. JEL 0842]|nr:hypothetical protein HDV05_006533 [Chytridiales sp. JEL 0842]
MSLWISADTQQFHRGNDPVEKPDLAILNLANESQITVRGTGFNTTVPYHLINMIGRSNDKPKKLSFGSEWGLILVDTNQLVESMQRICKAFPSLKDLALSLYFEKGLHHMSKSYEGKRQEASDVDVEEDNGDVEEVEPNPPSTYFLVPALTVLKEQLTKLEKLSLTLFAEDAVWEERYTPGPPVVIPDFQYLADGVNYDEEDEETTRNELDWSSCRAVFEGTLVDFVYTSEGEW